MNAAFTTSVPLLAYFLYLMRQAYILQLGSETETSRLHFVGCIEEVDTGSELRFKSTDELLAFLAERFDKAKQQERDSEESCENQ